MSDTHPTTVGDDVTVGHGALLHGCAVEGSLSNQYGRDRAQRGRRRYGVDRCGRCAGRGRAPRFRRARWSWGSPARVRRSLTDDEVRSITALCRQLRGLSTRVYELMIAGVRGTRDILPGEVERWQRLEQVARDICRRYGYREIRTPVLEREDTSFPRGPEKRRTSSRRRCIPSPTKGASA